MARRKAHPGRWVLLACLGLVIAGAASRHWQEILTGVSGVTAMFFLWVAFSYVVRCDVKRRSKPGFCEREIRGVLFGCNDHYWDKALAWTRYLGLGRLARILHIELPILRWQTGRHAPGSPSPIASQPIAQAAFASGGSATTGQGSVESNRTYSPSPALQALSLYIGLISGIASIVGLGLSIIPFVK